jgi:hypothetical protein
MPVTRSQTRAQLKPIFDGKNYSHTQYLKEAHPIQSYCLDLIAYCASNGDGYMDRSCLFELLDETNMFQEYRSKSVSDPSLTPNQAFGQFLIAFRDMNLPIVFRQWIKYEIPLEVWIRDSGLTNGQTNQLRKCIASHLALIYGNIVIYKQI